MRRDEGEEDKKVEDDDEEDEGEDEQDENEEDENGSEDKDEGDEVDRDEEEDVYLRWTGSCAPRRRPSPAENRQTLSESSEVDTETK